MGGFLKRLGVVGAWTHLVNFATVQRTEDTQGTTACSMVVSARSSTGDRCWIGAMEGIMEALLMGTALAVKYFDSGWASVTPPLTL